MDPHPAAVVLQVTGRAHLQSRSADPLCSALSSISPFPCLVDTWLRAAGYLKTSNACEALTISGDCCWVISGKEVSLQFPQPPQRASHTHTFTHTYTIPVWKTTHNACKRKHTDSVQCATKHTNKMNCCEFRGAVVILYRRVWRDAILLVWLIGQKSGHGDKTHQHTRTYKAHTAGSAVEGR